MALISYVFPKILAPKNMARQMSKKACFKGPLDSEQVKLVETLLQSEWENFYNIY